MPSGKPDGRQPGAKFCAVAMPPNPFGPLVCWLVSGWMVAQRVGHYRRVREIVTFWQMEATDREGLVGDRGAMDRGSVQITNRGDICPFFNRAAPLRSRSLRHSYKRTFVACQALYIL